MKKILSLTLAALMLLSAVPMAMAADVNYDQGTKVEYTAANAESYTITVPAKLAPGDTGTVTAKGTWPSTKNLRVTADESIEMVNSISTASNKELDITFEPIILAGSQTAEVSTTSDITVENITDALFGTWSGTINYNVDYVVKLGDVNNNGKTNGSDAKEVFNIISNEVLATDAELIAADANQDGVVSEADALLIQEWYVDASAPGTYISIANATVPTIEYYPNLVGDVNGDGAIEAADAALAYRLVNNKWPDGMEMTLVTADANGDKVINRTDADMIYSYVNNTSVDGSVVGQYRQDVDNSEYTIEYTTTE